MLAVATYIPAAHLLARPLTNPRIAYKRVDKAVLYYTLFMSNRYSLLSY